MILLLIATVDPVFSQYFGRNKPGYRRFDFKVYESPHFRIYHYFENDSIINAVANTFEKWYIRQLPLFKDTFDQDRKSVV